MTDKRWRSFASIGWGSHSKRSYCKLVLAEGSLADIWNGLSSIGGNLYATSAAVWMQTVHVDSRQTAWKGFCLEYLLRFETYWLIEQISQRLKESLVAALIIMNNHGAVAHLSWCTHFLMNQEESAPWTSWWAAVQWREPFLQRWSWKPKFKAGKESSVSGSRFKQVFLLLSFFAQHTQNKTLWVSRCLEGRESGAGRPHSVLLLWGPRMVNSLSRAWAAYVCSTVLLACRWLMRGSMACSSCSLGSCGMSTHKQPSATRQRRLVGSLDRSCSTYLTSEDHDVLDGICLQHWKLIDCSDKRCLMSGRMGWGELRSSHTGS